MLYFHYLQSQEVTYAELGTLPRRSNGISGGYAQLRPTQNGVMTSDEPSVVYARINHHGSNNGRLRPMGNEASSHLKLIHLI